MKNFKINMNREPLSDADIAKGKDFNQLLKTYQAMKTPFFKTPKFWFGGGAAVLVASVAAVLMYGKMARMDSTGGTDLPFIAPPVAQADIKTDAYLLNAQSDSVIHYTSGSLIHVPANAFLTAEGTVAKGTVELHYREFKKVSDVFLSGIPMTYDSAGEQYHFETAGMMEISATQDGKPLKTNPDALIKVDMVSANKEDRFNTYYLDTTERKWKYLAQSNYTGKAVSQTGDSTRDITAQPPLPKLAPSSDPVAQKVAVVQEEIAQLKKQKPVEPKKLANNAPHFSIKVDEKEFPEIAVYNNLKFQVADQHYDANKANVVWEDVQMKRVVNSTNYAITFSKGKESYTVVASPVFADKDFKEAQKLYEQKYQEYLTALNKKKADEAKLQADLEGRAKEIEARVREELAAQERARKEYEAKMEQTDLVFRTFQVANFGIWNCDCPNALPQGAIADATLVNAKTGEKLKISYCYLVEKGRNAMFSYYPGRPDLNSVMGFRYNPTKENMIWAVTADMKVAVLKAEDFRNTPTKTGKMELEMTVIDKKLGSTEEARAYLEI